MTADQTPDLGLEATVPALASRVAGVRRQVAGLARQAGFDADRVDDIALAVSEVMTNAVVHAYRDDPAGELHVSAWLDVTSLHVRVVDRGLGFSRRDDSPGLGIGLALARMVAEDLRIDAAEPRGTVVRLRFDR